MIYNKVVTLTLYVFSVDGIAFVFTFSWKIKFMTVKHTTVHTARQVVKFTKPVLRVCNHAGFTVRYIIVDWEFEKVKEELTKILFNPTAAKDHVAEEEREVIVIKEKNTRHHGYHSVQACSKANKY